jgi:hemerythrin
MNKILWSDKFSVGNAKLDAQHQVIIDLINKLVDLQAQPFDKVSVRAIYSDLVKYGMEHLKYEEDLLNDHDYQDIVKHKHEHYLYVKQVTKSLKDTVNTNEESLGEMIVFLSDWWTEHILEEDMKYKSFLADKIRSEK